MDGEITPEPSEAERKAILVALSHEQDPALPQPGSRWGRLDPEEGEEEG